MHSLWVLFLWEKIMQINQITAQKRGGIYYTDEINGAETGTLTCSKLVLTSTTALIDTRIDQISARHIKKDVVIVRGKR